MEGVRSLDCVIRLSAKLLAMLDSHSATTSSTPNLINSNGVNRSPPSTIETESSVSIVGVSWPVMLKARHKPCRQRHQADDKRVANDRCHEADNQPGQCKLGGDREQIAAAWPGR